MQNNTILPNSQPQRFHVNLAALIQLLSRHFYGQGENVIIRELLQNAVDSHTARRLADPTWKGGTIAIEMQSGPTGWTLVVADEGIGVHPNEVESCFATICDSLKRTDGWESGNSPFRGRFGVGQLSVFIVAEQVTIVSKKAGNPGGPAFRWTGRADGTWEMQPAPNVSAAGTQVFVELPASWTPEKVFDLARKFGRFLDEPIVFRAGGEEKSVSEKAPWVLLLDDGEMLRRATELFDGEKFLDVFRFHDETTGTKGLGCIVNRAVSPGTQPLHRLYSRGIFVSDKVRGLTPAFAPFVRVVADSWKLRVNAAREDLHGEEKHLASLQKTVGTALVKWLEATGKSDAERVARIVVQQHESILAAVDAGHVELLSELARALPLQTTQGPRTYDQIVHRHHKFEYVDNEKDWGRIEQKARQEGHCVARADYRSADQLIRAIIAHRRNAPICHISATEYLARFHAENHSDGAEELKLRAVAKQELEKDECSMEFTESEDPYELATLELNDGESIERFFRQGRMDNESGDTAVAQKLLRVNKTHSLAEKLLAGPDMPTEQLRAWIRIIYQHALLASREIPTTGENRRHARALGLIFSAMGGAF